MAVLSYFEGTANLHCYTSCTLTTLHCSKVLFLQCCPMKRYNNIFEKMWGVYSLLWDTVNIHLYLRLSYGTASEHMKYSAQKRYGAILCFVLSWGLTTTQNSIRTTSDLDQTRLTHTQSAENDLVNNILKMCTLCIKSVKKMFLLLTSSLPNRLFLSCVNV